MSPFAAPLPLLPLAIALGVLGAILGSFIATLAIRWPAGRSVVAGRSTCDGCGHVVRARDLVPLVSWIALRGRCRDCGAPIDTRHLVVELLALAIGVSSALASPDAAGIAGALFGWMLLTLAALDWAALWLPDVLTGSLAALGLGSGLLGIAPGMSDRIAGGMAGWACLWLIALAYRRWRGRDGLGGGDAKLLGGIGLWLGWRMLPAVLLVSSTIGLGIALGMAMRGRAVARDTAMPFGTLMALAAYLGWLAMSWVGG